LVQRAGFPGDQAPLKLAYELERHVPTPVVPPSVH